MRKSLTITGLVAAAVFTVGYVAGQIGGVAASSAASKPAAQTTRGYGGPPGIALGPRADGTVTAINGSTITIKADGNPGPSPSNEYTNVTTIDLTGGTTYLGGPTKTVTAADIKVGSFIVVDGTLSSDGTTVTATKVMLGGPRMHGPGPGGPMGFGPRGAHFRGQFAPPGAWR
ncbi:MAG TPA: DUF5666 domain-containing protein [Chloroflexota bacterium]|jgi:hypothetical protein|nr:DUF5666 domain-containing protein [Chloroflexota bacterium]